MSKHIHLSKPNCGWSSLVFTDDDIQEAFTYPLSYVDDVPEMIFRLCFDYLKKHSACEEFDAEGWHWMLCVSDYNIYVIHGGEDELYVFSDTDTRDFLKTILTDMSDQIDAWCEFSAADAYGDTEEDVRIWEEAKAKYKRRYEKQIAFLLKRLN